MSFRGFQSLLARLLGPQGSRPVIADGLYPDDLFETGWVVDSFSSILPVLLGARSARPTTRGPLHRFCWGTVSYSLWPEPRAD